MQSNDIKRYKDILRQPNPSRIDKEWKVVMDSRFPTQASSIVAAWMDETDVSIGNLESYSSAIACGNALVGQLKGAV